MLCVFGASCVLVVLAAFGIVDAILPDDDFWIRHKDNIPENSHDA